MTSDQIHDKIRSLVPLTAIMSLYPHTQLFPTPSTTVVISGPNVQVLDTATGVLCHTIADRVGPVRCAALDAQGKYLATAGDDKMLKIRKVDGLGLVNERELPKRPTKVIFTADGQTILVSDKFGDVFRQFTPLTEKQKKDALSSHENPSGGQLILGHASLLSAFLLSSDEEYIITADRDEHIRVSWYPQGYNIEMYCLGHTKFVSAIHNPTFAPSELVSGGGDPALKIWDWMTGTVKHDINVWDAVEPYIRIPAPKKRRREDDDDVPEAKRKGRGKKAKGKGKAKPETEAKAEEVVEEAQEGGAAAPSDALIPEKKAEKVLVINKIDTAASRHIVFSAVGATALFTTSYPSDAIASEVRAFDLGRPVLNFTVTDDGLIWVCLDGNWTDGTPEKPEKAFVRVLELSSGDLVEVARDSPLLATLNSKSLQPVSADDLKELDLYGDLAAMPKNTEVDDDQEGETSTPADAEKTTNKKVLGRLKNKQAVFEKAQAMASASASTPMAEDGVKEPETKKTKSEIGDDSQQDVVITET
ncbi:hypothetical protein D9615_003555 [Tricholomella constricta]|uniref:Transfer RNA methyltransferase 82 n=1 Tax=Tricholomella constricta TaxID=117010 RepID=A0A8H5HHT4_9AGAR|nr:hypothetical protein D9615_003555 [Tricholomella constricta]